MRVFGFCLLALLSIVGVAWSQGKAPPSGHASTTPSVTASGLSMFRPVLIGQGPSALINRIDEQDLIRKGQKDALVMFLCGGKKECYVPRHTRFGFSKAGIAKEDFTGVQSQIYSRGSRSSAGGRDLLRH